MEEESVRGRVQHLSFICLKDEIVSDSSSASSAMSCRGCGKGKESSGDVHRLTNDAAYELFKVHGNVFGNMKIFTRNSFSNPVAKSEGGSRIQEKCLRICCDVSPCKYHQNILIATF